MHTHDIYPPLNYVVKFTRQPVQGFQISDTEAIASGNGSSKGIFLKAPVISHPLKGSFKNTGNQNLQNVTATKELFLQSGMILQSDQINLPSFSILQDTSFVFPSSFTTSIAGTYFQRNKSSHPFDGLLANNRKDQELVVLPSGCFACEHSFTDNVSENAIEWVGGSGGIGVYFKPVYAPFYINKVSYYIAYNPGGIGFRSRIYVCDGIPGLNASVLLDTLYSGWNAIGHSWNHIIFPEPILVADTGVYISWEMVGTDIGLGTDETIPLSYQNYAVIGSTWAPFRFNPSEDAMIKASFSQAPNE